MLSDKNFYANFKSSFCADGIPRAPLPKHSAEGGPLDATPRSRLAPSFVTARVAVKCSQTGQGISSLCVQIKQQHALSWPPRCPATHTHAYNDQDIVHFPPIMLGPQKGRAQRWTTSSLLSGKVMFGQRAGQGSGDVWPALCSVRLPTKRERKKNAGPQVAVKTKTCFVQERKKGTLRRNRSATLRKRM